MLGMNNIFVVQNEGDALFSSRRSEVDYFQKMESIDAGMGQSAQTKEELFMSTKVLKGGHLIDLPG